MPDNSPVENDFLNQVAALVEANISNEQFGVSELADLMNMSRSNLLRKVKKLTNLSVSQLIRDVRLKRAMEMLEKTSLNVSEISHQVGFGSTSYFIKCFREHYGYPPGEVGKRETAVESPSTPMNLPPQIRKKRNFFILVTLGLMVALTIGLLIYYYYYYSRPSGTSTSIEKSIAVLPFKNESNDSTNVYLINGLMESTLTNLQKIKDLKVISRTSTEKYRNTSKSIPEMAKELNVRYFVEGSGQKIGDRILLNIQLIEASTDRHLWAKQYRTEVKDIFELQQEIAKNIAAEIQVIITPEEEKRIEKNPTDNLVAYDFYLKGRDIFYKGKGRREDLEEALSYFKKAIEQDNKFALAYADATIVYYYLDVFQKEKKFAVELNNYADKALFYDSKLGESQVAKALSYMVKKDYESAVLYLEKALEYNPNSGLAMHFLSELYNIHTPNTAKYLEYALKKVRVDVGSQDSATMSFNYLQVSNAFLQTGFLDEAMLYINKSLDLNPENPFGYIKIFIAYAKTKDLKKTKQLLIEELNKDTTRFDITLQLGTVCHSMGDYDLSYYYYKKFIRIRDTKQLDVYKNEHLKIADVLAKMGLKEKSEEYLKSFKDYVDNDRSIYKHLQLTLYYSYQKDTKKAIEHFRLFSKEDNFQYWVLLMEMEPLVASIKDLPEFKKIMRDIENKFWNDHKKIRASLEDEGLL
jgi:TolB-like protein/AraC-like DNA-binding protein